MKHLHILGTLVDTMGANMYKMGFKSSSSFHSSWLMDITYLPYQMKTKYFDITVTSPRY